MKMFPALQLMGMILFQNKRYLMDSGYVQDIVMFVHTIMRHSFNCMVQQNIREILQQIIISGKKIILSLHRFIASLWVKNSMRLLLMALSETGRMLIGVSLFLRHTNGCEYL